MTEIALRMYSEGGQALLAAADAELVGQLFQEGKFRLDVTAGFYDGLRVNEDSLREHLSLCTIANLVGPVTIGVAVAAGLVDEASVMRIDGIPHAQMMVY